jgi:hypothetical protein
MITEVSADSLIPGDILDTRCGIPGFVRVTNVRYIDRPVGLSDLVEITWDDNSISPCRTYRAGSTVRTWVGDPSSVL